MNHIKHIEISIISDKVLVEPNANFEFIGDADVENGGLRSRMILNIDIEKRTFMKSGNKFEADNTEEVMDWIIEEFSGVV